MGDIKIMEFIIRFLDWIGSDSGSRKKQGWFLYRKGSRKWIRVSGNKKRLFFSVLGIWSERFSGISFRAKKVIKRFWVLCRKTISVCALLIGNLLGSRIFDFMRLYIILEIQIFINLILKYNVFLLSRKLLIFFVAVSSSF